MPNYNNNNTRDNSIDELPRLIFQLPNTDSGTALPSANPVFFCQSGCAIDYKFSNIRSCQFNNDGRKFTITPTDRTNINYIMWNGTDINSGEKMTQFTLKEVYFTAPAKDYLGINRDILTQSIQCYFVFVNEKYSNLMICVSVIGSVNNLGNAPKSNGFVMMETLATRIPSVNVQSQLNNLNNFNLGTLIPPNKPFFSTLITNNIQYIISTEVVDVPISFFSNIVSMVNGGTQLYNAKMNQNRTNIPQNPSTTILFYNENSQMLNDNQNFVCNSNCDLVPGKKITPSIGTVSSTQSTKKPARPPRTVSGGELPPEKCETKDVWENQPTKPKPVKDPSKPDGSTTSSTTGSNNIKNDPTVFAISMSLMTLLCMGTAWFVSSKTLNLKLSFAIIIIIIFIIPIIVGFVVGSNLYYKDNKNHWIPYLVGLIIWVAFILPFHFITKKYNVSNYSSFNLNMSQLTNKQQPYSGITVPTGFNQPKQSFFGKMFSSSSQDKSTDYSPQITVPTAQNTEPKQSVLGRMFSSSSQNKPTNNFPQITVPTAQNTKPKQSVLGRMFKKSPESTATVPSSIIVPQSISPQSKLSFLSKINPFSKSSTSPETAQISPADLIKSKTKIIDDIQRTSMNQKKKNSLIKKINSSTNSNIVQRLNEAYKELNKMKSSL
jgi:hypothetical protein